MVEDTSRSRNVDIAYRASLPHIALRLKRHLVADLSAFQSDRSIDTKHQEKA